MDDFQAALCPCHAGNTSSLLVRTAGLGHSSDMSAAPLSPSSSPAPSSPRPPQRARSATPPSLRPPRFQTIRTITALILREMGSTFGRSPGGYVWAVVQPLGMIAVLALGFSILVRKPALGTSFILFYATGYLPFDLYGDISNKVTTALNYSRPLLAYPRVTWMDAVLARLILNTLTNLTVACILISAILMLIETRTVIQIIPIVTGMGLVVLTGLGVGLLNCLLFSLYPVWAVLWGIINRPLFLASGVLFLYEGMPKFAQDVLWWNPLLHAISEVRTGFYPTYHGDFVSLSYAYGVALVLVALGLLLLGKHYKTVLEQ